MNVPSFFNSGWIVVVVVSIVVVMVVVVVFLVVDVVVVVEVVVSSDVIVVVVSVVVCLVVVVVVVSVVSIDVVVVVADVVMSNGNRDGSLQPDNINPIKIMGTILLMGYSSSHTITERDKTSALHDTAWLHRDGTTHRFAAT